MHKQFSDALSPNTPPIMVKNEIDVIAYTENNLTDPSEVYYGRFQTDVIPVLMAEDDTITITKHAPLTKNKNKPTKTWRQHHCMF